MLLVTMVQKNMSIQEDVYNKLTSYKDKYMSYSDVIVVLMNEHDELAKLKADMERCKPE